MLGMQHVAVRPMLCPPVPLHQLLVIRLHLPSDRPAPPTAPSMRSDCNKPLCPNKMKARGASNEAGRMLHPLQDQIIANHLRAWWLSSCLSSHSNPFPTLITWHVIRVGKGLMS